MVTKVTFEINANFHGLLVRYEEGQCNAKEGIALAKNFHHYLHEMLVTMCDYGIITYGEFLELSEILKFVYRDTVGKIVESEGMK